MNVVITGILGSVKMPRLIFLFKPALKKVGIKKFWIKEMYNIPGTDTQGATIEFENFVDAKLAAGTLDGFVYHDGQTKHPMRASIGVRDSVWTSPIPGFNSQQKDGHGSDLDRDRERYSRDGQQSRERERSRSPLYANDEASKLDLEIELLKKKRMIIEEERRLLLEKKKLEMAKECGSSDVKLKEYIVKRDRNRWHRERDEPMYPPRRPPHSQDKFVSKGQSYHKMGTEKDKPTKLPYKERLPAFYAPCNLIMGRMKEVISENVEQDQKNVLYQLLRTTLRKRLTIALGGHRKKLDTKQIVKVYRECHPPDTDELLVRKILDDIKACNLTESSIVELSAKAKKKAIKRAAKMAGVESTSAEKVAGQVTKQEDTSAEVNKKVETDKNADNVITKPEEVKVEGIKHDITADNSLVEKANTEAIDKKKEHGLSVDSSKIAMGIDNFDGEDWDAGDDWTDFETEIKQPGL